MSKARIKDRIGAGTILAGAVLTALVYAGALFGIQGCHWFGKKPNVLLITVDTTRADHLRCYGYDRIETPTLDRLAADGILFERAYSLVPLTLPAHTSIMTSTPPLNNGVEDNGAYRVPDELMTMAEILKANGYQTAAFISAAVLKRMFNLNQGFETWNEEGLEPQKQMDTLVNERKGDKTADAALAWLAEHYQKPFFLWVHFYDPHAAYDPPPPFDALYPLPYDGEIAFMDSQIKRVLDRLKEDGIYDNTFIIIVGDHGEGLGDHGELTHSVFIYESTTHVPLIARIPESKAPGGKRVKTVVSQLDILPTALDYLGIDIPAQAKGQSLKPIIESETEPEQDRFAFMEAKMTFLHYGWSPLSALVGSRYRYIKAPTPELYDLSRDKKELDNLWTKECDDDKSSPDCKAANQMRQRLDALEREWGKSSYKSDEAEVSPREKEQLEALGYIVGGFHGNAELALKKDPKDFKDIIMPLQNQNQARNNHEWDWLSELTEKVLKRDPENPMALQNLADCQFARGEYREEIETYHKILEIHGENDKPYRNLGVVYIRLSALARNKGDLEVAENYLREAEDNFKQSIKIKEQNLISRYYLGRVQMELGEFNDALANFQWPGLADSELGHVGMGLLYERQGRAGLAEAEFDRAKEVSGDKSVIYWGEYAQYLMRHNRGNEALELLEKALKEDNTLENEPMFMKALEDLRSRKKPDDDDKGARPSGN
jgi:arylsulfatase A-like enzyme